MHCLLVDNYDSFTWNLAHYVAEVFGEFPTVVRNDEYSWESLTRQFTFDCIIISPGPGTVAIAGDFGVSRDALLQDTIPVLGVCLGFQGLAHIYGGTVTRAAVPFHGRSSAIAHAGDSLFAGLPSPFSAVRYHSLMVSPALPDELMPIAATEDGILMGLRHKTLPKWGVQFHPESILTEHGHRLIRNFRDLAQQALGRPSLPAPAPPAPRAAVPAPAQFQLLAREVQARVNAEDAFMDLYAAEEHVFWLDSAMVKEGLSRFSFMGEATPGNVRTYHCSDDTPDGAGGRAFIAALERDLAKTVAGGGDLPFAFRGGWVGHFSYEMKAVFGAGQVSTEAGATPDALWLYADRFIAFDHLQHRTWVVAIAAPDDLANAEEWVAVTSDYLRTLPVADAPRVPARTDQLRVTMDQGYDDYLASIESCKQSILSGDSYEVCLTNHFRFDARLDPVSLYRVIRKRNAAPFCALIRSGPVHVLSSSPERFLEVSGSGRIEAKPIKGTCARSADPATDRRLAENLRASEKDAAENLMIVDLMRNDLSRVSDVGSVTVDKLMDIETYATVHHMVSTVVGQLGAGRSLVDLLRSTFPGGSITGAPKIRTMEIIDDLEHSPRGVYCGSIGYLGYNRIADLNIAIRTLSYDGAQIRFGAGGAITYLSNPGQEFNEIMLKARALLQPIWSYLCGSNEPMNSTLSGRQLDIHSASEETRCIAH